MANTYTQIHLQLIFAVKYRAAIINETWKDELYKYITGIIKEQSHKLLIVNGMPDHIHLLIGYRPHQSLSDLMQDIKGGSSKWINSRNFCGSKFSWLRRKGMGAFSYSHPHLSNVIIISKDKKGASQKKTFIEEYKGFLKAYEIEFDERYILKEPE